MCWFVTVAVAAKVEATLRKSAHACGLETSRQSNASIATVANVLSSLDGMPVQPQLWSVTRGGCSCDLVKPARKSIALRDDLRSLIAQIAELGQPVAVVAHTYRGKLDESFELTRGPRMTPDELRVNDALPPDAVCVVRSIPQFKFN